MPLRLKGGQITRRGGGLRNRLPNTRAPTNADLGFIEPSFNATTDQDAGTYLFTAEIKNAAIFTLQGYTFSNWRRTSGFSKLTGGTATDTTRPFTSNSMVLGDAGLEVSCTISVDWSRTDPITAEVTTDTISATITGSIEAPPGTAVLANITLTNDSGSTTPLIVQMGHVFPQGAVPSAFTLAARRLDTQAAVTVALDGPASWSDGSLAWTGLYMVEPDITIAAGASLVVELYGVVGSRTPSSTGYDPWGWLDTNTDMKVELTGMQQGISSITDMSPSQRDIVLNDHMAVTTRRTRYLDHPRVQVLKVWGMADGDGHLKGEHFITIFRDGDGDELGALYECVVAQDWWVADPGFGDAAETKQKRHYFATLKNGSTTIQAYTGDGASAKIQHPYHSAWSTVQRTGQQKGHPFWIAGSQATQPTLRVTIDADYWLSSNLLAPYEAGVTVGKTLADTNYDPGRAFNFQPAIDSTGGSDNRGWLTVNDVLRLLKQDASTDRNWRTSALAGLHCTGYRVRNHLTDATVGDVTNLPIPFQIQTLSSSASTNLTTGVLAGLGTRQLYQRHSNSGMTLSWTSDGSTSGNVGQRSATAAWNQGADNSHAPPWGYFPALLTGRRVFREAAIDSAFRSFWAIAGGCIKQQTRETSGQGRAAIGWPVRYSTPLQIDGQTRAIGWGLNVLANGWRVCEDGSPLKTHLDEIVGVTAAVNKWRLDQITAQTSTRQYDRRLYYWYSVTNAQEWENFFMAAGFARASEIIDGNTNLKAVADYTMARAVQLAASDYPLMGQSLWYQNMPTNSQIFNPPTADVALTDQSAVAASIDSVDATVLNLSVAGGVNTYKNAWKPTVNDPITFAFRSSGAQPPTNITVGAVYYIKEIVSASKIRVSATQGGSNISFTAAGAGTFVMYCTAPQALLNITDPWTSGLNMAPYDSNDDYFHIYLAGLTWALRRPDLDADAGDVTDATTAARAMWDAWRGRVDSLALSYGLFNPAWMLERP